MFNILEVKRRANNLRSTRDILNDWYHPTKHSRPISDSQLLQLPTELLLEIVKAEPGSLATLRLVHTKLCAITTPILFSTINVFSQTYLEGFCALLEAFPEHGRYYQNLTVGSNFQLVRDWDVMRTWKDLDIKKIAIILQKLPNIKALCIRTTEPSIHLHKLPSDYAKDYFELFQRHTKWELIQKLEIDVGFDPEWTELVSQASSQSIRTLVLRLPSSRPVRYSRLRRMENFRIERIGSDEVLIPKELDSLLVVNIFLVSVCFKIDTPQNPKSASFSNLTIRFGSHIEPAINLKTLLHWTLSLKSVCLHMVREKDVEICANYLELLLDRNQLESMLEPHILFLNSLALLDIVLGNSLSLQPFTNLKRLLFTVTDLESLAEVLDTENNLEELYILVSVKQNGIQFEEDLEKNTLSLLRDMADELTTLRTVHMIVKIWQGIEWGNDMNMWSQRQNIKSNSTFICSYYNSLPESESQYRVELVGIEPDLPADWLEELKHF
jgi:hypothetical protein